MRINFPAGLIFLLFLRFSSVQGQVNCPEEFKSACPQSTFTSKSSDAEGVWVCPRNWLKTSFSSERWNHTLKPIDTSNLTAEVKYDNNMTSIELCTVTPKNRDIKGIWPEGSYCIPSPTNDQCPDTMNRVAITISAPGRNFTCSDNTPMTNCGNGTFDLNACCPKVMSSNEEYLNVPMYIDTFYLLKSNATCPKVYSYTVAEETVKMDQATVTVEMGEHFAREVNGSLVITFCKYSLVTCLKSALDNSFESLITEDTCNRFETHYCVPPYKGQPDGSPFIEYCLPSGNYSHNFFCGLKCPNLPSITNATYTPDTNSSRTEVSVKCTDGCFVKGPDKTFCQQNGTWSTDLSNTTCQYTECKELDLVNKGANKWLTDNTSTPFAYGHNVSYYCSNTGPNYCYYLPRADNLKNQTVTCQSNGTWSDEPRCLIGRKCKPPANTTTAFHAVVQNKLYCESTVDYTCKPHHLSQGDSMTLTCQPDGTFDVDPPNCTTVFCDNPTTNLTNGDVEIISQNGSISGKWLETDTIRYECDPKYRLGGDDLITCQSNGQWNGSVNASCALIRCPLAPLNISHGYRIDNLRNKTVFLLGDEIEYQCVTDDYQLNFSDPITCTNDGTWNPYIPSCNIVSCNDPPSVNHSIPVKGPFPINSTLTYQCQVGYKASGGGPLKCQRTNGVLGWQGNPPTCGIVKCKAPPALSHGNYTTFTTSYTYNTKINYTCEQGYNATERFSTNCSEFGDWRPPPRCNPVKCRPPDVEYSIANVTKALYAYHEVIRIRCDDSRIYQPPQDLLCSENGLWEVISGDKFLISCAEAIHGHDQKWTLLGVGLAMFIILVALLIGYVIKRRRDDQRFDKHRFSVNPAYKPDENELTGFNNPTYEDSEPQAFRIDKAGSSRLVLKTESASDPQQYDTLRGVRGGSRLEETIEEPQAGQYNTLQQLKPQARHDIKETEDVYNIPSTNATLANHYTRGPSTTDITVGSDYGDDEDVYNVPTMERIKSQPISSQYVDNYGDDDDVYNIPTMERNRSNPKGSQIGMVEVNNLYNSVEASQICGTPLETDFDNIIYDKI